MATSWLAGQRRAVQLGGGSVALVLLAALGAAGLHGMVRSVDDTVDLTRDATLSLSPASVAIVASLEVDVQLIGFYAHGSSGQRRFTRLARQLEAAGPRLRTEVVDPLRNPLRAEQYEVERESGTVVVQAGERIERIVGRDDEQTLLDTIVRVASDEEHVVCWSMGHGEASPDDDQDPDAASAAVLALEGKNYQVLHTRLLSGPPDATCEVLVIDHPRVDPLAHERDAIAAYLAGGGQVLLLEPGTTLSPQICPSSDSP